MALEKYAAFFLPYLRYPSTSLSSIDGHAALLPILSCRQDIGACPSSIGREIDGRESRCMISPTMPPEIQSQCDQRRDLVRINIDVLRMVIVLCTTDDFGVAARDINLIDHER